MSEEHRSCEGRGPARGFAKSLIRLPWVLTVFGADQLTRWFDPRRRTRASTAAIEAVRQAAEEGLGDTARAFYRTGNHFQEGMVDTVLDLAAGPWKERGGPLHSLWQRIDRSSED